MMTKPVRNSNFLFFSHRLFAYLLLVMAVFLSACDQPEQSSINSLGLPEPGVEPARDAVPGISQLEKIKQRGSLIVLTSNLPTTYYFDRDDKLAGPEYEMTQSFAKSLKLKVEYKLYDSTKDLLAALRNNEGDIAAAGLTVNEKRRVQFDFGPVYQTIDEYLVCHRSHRKVDSADELKDLEIVVAADSNYIESLASLFPEVFWATDHELNTTKLMEEVAQKNVECVVSDSHLYDIERRYHTEIKKKYTLMEGSELAWVLNKHNDELKQAIEEWFSVYKTEQLGQLMDKYYGYIEIFDYVDTHKFLQRVPTRLKQYKDFFIQAAEENNIKPSILAAQSYQESHWDRKAKSPTGVRGIMMLTQPVAKSLGVTNRLHAEQNIFAGAKFHAKMKKMVADVPEPDRTWLALAAYNIGRGHFRDAQSLARKLGKNPDNWYQMKEVLPLLSEKKYYQDLRYGYARGGEPVRYVARIRNYEALLVAHFIDNKNDKKIKKSVN